MDSERIPCGLQLLLRHQRVKRANMIKKYFLTLDSLWLATGNINGYSVFLYLRVKEANVILHLISCGKATGRSIL